MVVVGVECPGEMGVDGEVDWDMDADRIDTPLVYTLAGSAWVQTEVLEKIVRLARYAWTDIVAEKKRQRRGSEAIMVKKLKFYQTGIFQAIAAFVLVPLVVLVGGVLGVVAYVLIWVLGVVVQLITSTVSKPTHKHPTHLAFVG